MTPEHATLFVCFAFTPRLGRIFARSNRNLSDFARGGPNPAVDG